MMAGAHMETSTTGSGWINEQSQVDNLKLHVLDPY
jgi:hypothetical protein